MSMSTSPVCCPWEWVNTFLDGNTSAVPLDEPRCAWIYLTRKWISGFQSDIECQSNDFPAMCPVSIWDRTEYQASYLIWSASSNESTSALCPLDKKLNVRFSVWYGVPVQRIFCSYVILDVNSNLGRRFFNKVNNVRDFWERLIYITGCMSHFFRWSHRVIVFSFIFRGGWKELIHSALKFSFSV